MVYDIDKLDTVGDLRKLIESIPDNRKLIFYEFTPDTKSEYENDYLLVGRLVLTGISNDPHRLAIDLERAKDT